MTRRDNHILILIDAQSSSCLSRYTEAKTDAALLAAASLMQELVEARAATDVVPHTGQEALLRLARAQLSLIEGSTNIFRVHDSMSQIGRELGIFDEDDATPKLGLVDGFQEEAAA